MVHPSSVLAEPQIKTNLSPLCKMDFDTFHESQMSTPPTYFTLPSQGTLTVELKNAKAPHHMVPELK